MTTTSLPTACDCEDSETGAPLAPTFVLVSEIDEVDVDTDDGEHEIVGRSMSTTRRYECDGCGTRYERTTPYGAE